MCAVPCLSRLSRPASAPTAILSGCVLSSAVCPREPPLARRAHVSRLVRRVWPAVIHQLHRRIGTTGTTGQTVNCSRVHVRVRIRWLRRRLVHLVTVTFTTGTFTASLMSLTPVVAASAFAASLTPVIHHATAAHRQQRRGDRRCQPLVERRGEHVAGARHPSRQQPPTAAAPAPHAYPPAAVAAAPGSATAAAAASGKALQPPAADAAPRRHHPRTTGIECQESKYP